MSKYNSSSAGGGSNGRVVKNSGSGGQRGSGAPLGRGRQGGGGQQSGVDNKEVPQEGVYVNERLMYTLTNLIGNNIEVHVRNGDCFEGVFKTFSQHFEVVLLLASRKNADNNERVGDSGDECKTMIIRRNEIVFIQSLNADLEHAVTNDGQGSEVSLNSRSNGQAAWEKELEPWDGGMEEMHTMHDLDDDGCRGGGWDAVEMFRTNREKFHVGSSFETDLSQYTTKLRKEDTDEYRAKERKAERIAQEIERSNGYRERSALENGDNEEDEEMAFSAVHRANNSRGSSQSSEPARPSSGSTSGQNVPKYMAPHLRAQQNRVTSPAVPPPAKKLSDQDGVAAAVSSNSVMSQPESPAVMEHSPAVAESQQYSVQDQPGRRIERGAGVKGSPSDNRDSLRQFSTQFHLKLDAVKRSNRVQGVSPDMQQINMSESAQTDGMTQDVKQNPAGRAGVTPRSVEPVTGGNTLNDEPVNDLGQMMPAAAVELPHQVISQPMHHFTQQLTPDQFSQQQLQQQLQQQQLQQQQLQQMGEVVILKEVVADQVVDYDSVPMSSHMSGDVTALPSADSQSKKSSLNPLAKEFNPLAKPFVPRSSSVNTPPTASSSPGTQQAPPPSQVPTVQYAMPPPYNSSITGMLGGPAPIQIPGGGFVYMPAQALPTQRFTQPPQQQQQPQTQQQQQQPHQQHRKQVTVSARELPANQHAAAMAAGTPLISAQGGTLPTAGLGAHSAPGTAPMIVQGPGGVPQFVTPYYQPTYRILMPVANDAGVSPVAGAVLLTHQQMMAAAAGPPPPAHHLHQQSSISLAPPQASSAVSQTSVHHPYPPMGLPPSVVTSGTPLSSQMGAMNNQSSSQQLILQGNSPASQQFSTPYLQAGAGQQAPPVLVPPHVPPHIIGTILQTQGGNGGGGGGPLVMPAHMTTSQSGGGPPHPHPSQQIHQQQLQQHPAAAASAAGGLVYSIHPSAAHPYNTGPNNHMNQ